MYILPVVIKIVIKTVYALTVCEPPGLNGQECTLRDPWFFTAEIRVPLREGKLTMG